jgi:hypothetical protein
MTSQTLKAENCDATLHQPSGKTFQNDDTISQLHYQPVWHRTQIIF